MFIPFLWNLKMMRTKWAAINLALLMIISTTLTYMVDFEETNQIHEEDLEENSQVSGVDSRSQTYAEWKFDTTQFAMMYDNANQDLYPCTTPVGWSVLEPNSLDVQTVGDIQPWDAPSWNSWEQKLIDNEDDPHCFSWEKGFSVDYYDFSTSSSSTEFAPPRKSHQYDVSNTAWYDYTADLTFDTTEITSDNIIDMGIDDDGNLYVVGAWDGDKLVFPNKVGTHVYLDNSGYQGEHDHDVFVAKMDNTGVWLWATSIVASGAETATSISVSGDGKSVIGGTFACLETNAVDLFFPDEAKSSISSSHTSGISIPCQDFDTTGFVAMLNADGGFMHVKVLETGNTFSTVTDIAYDGRSGEIHYIGMIGGTGDSTLQPEEDSYVLGQMKVIEDIIPNHLNQVWLEYMDSGIVLTEIEPSSNSITLLGFKHGATQSNFGDESFSEAKIIVSRINTDTQLNEPTYLWIETCMPATNIDINIVNPAWALSAHSSNIAMLVNPGTQCGELDSDFSDFQAVSIDMNGNWVWSQGSKMLNQPSPFSTAAESQATDMAHSSNGDVLVSVTLSRYIRTGGVFAPKHGAPDMLLLRLDDDTGKKIWHHQEINKDCSNGKYKPTDGNTNVCDDNKRGGADARRIIVNGLDEIYVSGMIYGKEIYLHDGLPEHCDYDYARPYTSDDNSNWVTVNPELDNVLFSTTTNSGSSLISANYKTACMDKTDWENVSGVNLPNPNLVIQPQHGTQWHGGDPYFAKFDACPHAPIGISGGDIDYRESGRSDWRVFPLGEPMNVEPTRYECGESEDYADPIPNDDDDEVKPVPPIGNSPVVDLCDCNPQDSLKNLTVNGGLSSVNFVEITNPALGGPQQGPNSNYYNLGINFAANNALNGIFSSVIPDMDMMTFENCDLYTQIGSECYDFYTSDPYGNYDRHGEFLAIRTYTPELSEFADSGNFDAVWLNMNDGTKHYASDIVYFNHGVNQAGTSNEVEILGDPSNDLTQPNIANPEGFTTLGVGFTLIVLCFDTLPTHRHDHSENEEEIMESAKENLSNENKFALLQNYSASLPCGFNPTLTSVNVSSNYPVYEYGDIVTITYDLECLIEPVHYILRGELTGSNGVQITAHHPVEYQFIAGAPSTPDFEVQHDGISFNPDNSLVFEILDVDEYCVTAILDYDHGQLQYYDTHCFQVNPNRALLDDDGDGVSNDIDECEDTREGRDVDEVGCSTPGLSAFSVILVTIGAALVAVRHRTATEELEQMISDMDEKVP